MENYSNNNTNINVLRAILANCLIVLGTLMLFTAFTLSQFSWLTTEPVKALAVPSSTPQTEVPTTISVGQINHLQVTQGEISEGQWSLNRDKAMFLKNGGQINKPGNVIIYGHDTDQVLGKLFRINYTDQITLTSSTGKTYIYKIDMIKKVWPTEVSILNQPANINQLTVFTCEGLFDSQRLVIVAHQV
jgi:hypothetical protein